MPEPAPTPAQLAFERVLADHLVPLFKRHGYKKAALNWRRRHDGPGLHGWSLFNLQNSQWNDLNSIHFTFNVGVLWDAMPPHAPVSKMGPSLLSCHRHKRIGQFSSNHYDEWWEATADNLDLIVEALVSLLERGALPWIERQFADGAELATYKQDVDRMNSLP